MGSGPCSYLASVRNPYALLLMSPYTSIQNAAKSILGWASFISFIVYEKFRNIDAIKFVRCPVLLVHGKEDTLIPIDHSEQLYRASPRETYFHIPANMDHNEFSFEIDLIDPIKDFLKRIEIKKYKQNLIKIDNKDKTDKGLQPTKPKDIVFQQDELERLKIVKTAEYETRIKNFEPTAIMTERRKMARTYSEENIMDDRSPVTSAEEEIKVNGLNT